LYCIVFIHFYSASHNLSLSEALPTTAMVLGSRTTYNEEPYNRRFIEWQDNN